MFRYVRRQLAASWGAVLTLGVVALVTALVLSAAPRAVAAMHGDQAAWTVGETTPLTRDLIAVSGQQVPEDWDAYLTGLTDLRDEQPEPLHGLLGTPDFQVSASDPESVTPLPGSDLFSIVLTLRATPHLDEHATLVEGRWPETTAGPLDQFEYGSEDPRAARYPYEVAVSRQAAERFGWEAGHEYDLRTDGSSMVPLSSRANSGWGPLVVTGIYEQHGDPQGSWWRQNPIGGVPNVIQDPNTGLNAQAAAYVDPAMIDALSWGGASTTTWIPVSGDGLRADHVPGVLAQLRGIDAQEIPVDDGGSAAFGLDLDSGLTDVLATLLAQRAGVDAVIAVLAAGPLGAALAVLALGARLVIDRRRPALALLHARGASGAQLRAMAGLEGAAIGLVAAAAGFAIGLWAAPGQVTTAQVLLAAAAGLGPGVALALAAGPRGLRGGRSDLGRGRGRVRWILEVLVLAGAAVSTALLLQRGVVGGAGEAGAEDGGGGAVDPLPAAGVDPLLAASPLLLSLAVTLLAVRLFPLVTLAVERALARRRDLVPFLGAARATRDPAGGVVPAVALVLCVSVAATAAVLYSTVTGGVAREAWHEVGADLRVSGPEISEEVAAELSAIDGVAAVAPVTDHDRIAVAEPAGNGVRATLFTTDAAAMARAQEGVAGAPALTGTLGSRDTPGSEAVPLIVTRSTGYGAGQEVELRLPDAVVPGVVVEAVDQVAGLPGGEVLVLADDARLAGAVRAAEDEEGPPAAGPPARVALLALDGAGSRSGGGGGEPASAVVQGIREVLPNAVVDDPAAQAREILRSPASTGLVAAFVAAVVLAGLLVGAVLVMALMLAAPARARLLAVLRTLGLSARQGRGLVGWEIGPWIAVAVVAGAVLGGVVPVILLSAVDVTALTGGTQSPEVRWDPVLTAGLAAGLVVVAVVAVGLAAALGRRHEIAAQLRIER
ncbi:hypothetical protein [Myceligenerans pegani]|uniref:ABC transport system permease protein n=1 Tax=Myceligenerans pegani TaxID=2776917 RepID=A0ABR9MS64_9MICO|nr:hypothetical protein [Myceligenerans sp. TRM 65318]MBE1874214.1 hypothetical protein [Myceligenerans sp. TRM 65318]MBE3016485.1 hypothetical protein [Myceligenerans sp. TRM 65318]